MTAEIVVMNREAIVFAADSAVSTKVGGNTKISTSANKLFSLSREFPVGIMVFGNANFMGLPWETLIKYYRDHVLSKNGFPRLIDYAKDFFSYLNSASIKYSSESEQYFVASFTYTLFHELLDDIEEKMAILVESGEELTEEAIHELCTSIITSYIEQIKQLPEVLNLNDCKKVLSRYKSQISDIKKDVFHQLTLNSNASKLLNNALLSSLARRFMDNISSGVVIGGFGHDDFKPAVIECQVEGIINLDTRDGNKQILKHAMEDISDGQEYDNSAVLAFAQRDMVQRFMNGVDTNFLFAATSFLEEICRDFTGKIVDELDKYNEQEKEVISEQLSKYGEEIVEAFSNNMSQFVERYFNIPIVRAVSRLPKNELAIMAEALVNLTSLKRKISQDPETVAEPIDVAVITKGDGFIWIKRKHYFEASLNPYYFSKLSQENEDEK